MSERPESTTSKFNFSQDDYKMYEDRLWKVFERLGPEVARCRFCKQILAVKTSYTALKAHVIFRHYIAFTRVIERLKVTKTDELKSTVADMIEFVEKYPCLWDNRYAFYGNIYLQTEAWDKIASILFPFEVRSEIVTKMSKQFNRLKKAFVTKRNCPYQNELSFLKPLIEGENAIMSEANTINDFYHSQFYKCKKGIHRKHSMVKISDSMIYGED